MNIKVRLENSGTFIAISTYSRNAGKHGRFLVEIKNVLDWLCDEKRRNTTFYDSDCGHFLSMRNIEGQWLLMRFTWLSHMANGKVSGISESFYLSLADMSSAIDGQTIVLLCNDDESEGRVWWTDNARKNIQHMTQPMRRAFCKAMARGALMWPNTITEVYADGSNDFYFRTNDGLCGGLILHKNTGKYGTVYKYSVHT